MNFRRFGLRVGRRFLSGFNFIFPLVQVSRINREIRQREDVRSRSSEIAALKEAGLRLDDASRAEVATAFADDIARLRRLEDKLAWHLTVVALLFGAATAVGGVAISQHSLVGLILVIGAFIWLGSAGVLTLEANRATPLRTPDVVSFVERGDLELPNQVAGERLQALSLNPARGWQLNNALDAAQRNILVAVVLLVASSLVAAADQVGHDGEPSRQVLRTEHVVDTRLLSIQVTCCGVCLANDVSGGSLAGFGCREPVA